MIIARFLDQLVGRVERAEILDPPSEALAAASESALGGRQVTDLLSGTPLGHPLHPLLVAIPLGSWTSALLFDVLGEEEAAQTLTGLGVLAAIPTAAAGLMDWRYTAGGERRVGLAHAGLNTLALVAYAASWWLRRRGHRAAGIGLSGLGGTALTGGGWLGGHLSYALGVGVDTTAFQHSSEEWTAVAAEADVVSGRLLAASADGVPVLVTRAPDGAVVVLADRCTHRGGPLHEGELRAGCIVCPWHGSEFALDGSVVHGPATRPQAAYEVRVVDGQVLVRRADEPRTLRTNPVS
jgi:nitrite reductase/ring-hydroxylating ferredoxin subunit/uncharacterized membrane protein